MKRLTWLLFVAPVVVRAQSSLPGVAGGIATLRDRNFFASPTINPLAPPAGSPSPPRDASLPPPESNDNEIQILRPGSTTRTHRSWNRQILS